MEQPVNVFSVLWMGDFRKRTYSEEWVYKHKKMVARKLGPHNYYCLSNVKIPGVEVIPLLHNWPGWWSKVELFRPELPQGRNIYLDLDTLAVKNIDCIVNYPAKLAFHPPGYKLHGTVPSRGPDIRQDYNSSVIVWDSGEGAYFYDDFRPHYMKKLRSDQDWFGFRKPGLPLLTFEWFDRLKYCFEGPKKETRVVLCMPLKNERAAMTYPWVNKVWNGD